MSVLEERVGTLEQTVSGYTQRLNDLTGWQKSQNGSIRRVEEKLDKLIFWFMTYAFGTFATITIGVIIYLLGR